MFTAPMFKVPEAVFATENLSYVLFSPIKSMNNAAAACACEVVQFKRISSAVCGVERSAVDCEVGIVEISG